ncbi:unnamed protein product [Prorocentrum cordatum]|uniref:Uncharacterized protein n=1 Tax=Prorocentrum cordatum TaxID=2364126 RepID=A0ABN9PPD5_9DINO|nr:unnamed protein product [Polarella glacialis]
MHGMRDAAAGWEECHQEKLAMAGHKAGVSCPCAFANSDGPSSGAVHGAEFVFEGEERQLDTMERELWKHMQRREGKHIDVYCDSEWAGDIVDRKSVSSIFVFSGPHLLKSAVSTRGTTAPPSGEAEFTAEVRGTSVALEVKSSGADLGAKPFPAMRADSGAAKGILKRRGIGRIRHLRTPPLWVQEKRAKKDIEVHKTPGETNLVDLVTKEFSRSDMNKHLKTCGFAFEPGRHPKALAAPITAPGEIGGLSGYDRDQALRSDGALLTSPDCGAPEGHFGRSPGRARRRAGRPWTPRSITF